MFSIKRKYLKTSTNWNGIALALLSHVLQINNITFYSLKASMFLNIFDLFMFDRKPFTKGV